MVKRYVLFLCGLWSLKTIWRGWINFFFSNWRYGQTCTSNNCRKNCPSELLNLSSFYVLVWDENKNRVILGTHCFQPLNYRHTGFHFRSYQAGMYRTLSARVVVCTYRTCYEPFCHPRNPTTQGLKRIYNFISYFLNSKPNSCIPRWEGRRKEEEEKDSVYVAEYVQVYLPVVIQYTHTHTHTHTHRVSFWECSRFKALPVLDMKRFYIVTYMNTTIPKGYGTPGLRLEYCS